MPASLHHLLHTLLPGTLAHPPPLLHPTPHPHTSVSLLSCWMRYERWLVASTSSPSVWLFWICSCPLHTSALFLPTTVRHTHTSSCSKQKEQTHMSRCSQQKGHTHMSRCSQQKGHTHMSSCSKQKGHTHMSSYSKQKGHTHMSRCSKQKVACLLIKTGFSSS